MHIRASGTSELSKFSHFHILKLLFLSICCWYFRYFVGTNDMLIGLYTGRQISKCTDKTLKSGGGGGGGGELPQGAPEGSEQTRRGKPMFTNNGLPLQYFVSSEPSDAPD